LSQVASQSRAACPSTRRRVTDRPARPPTDAPSVAIPQKSQEK
jgi:hypothetical protein